MLEGLPYPTDEQRKRLRSKTLICHTDFRRCNVLTFLPQFRIVLSISVRWESRLPEHTMNGQQTVRGPSEVPIYLPGGNRRKLDTRWTVCRLLVRCEPGVMCICRCCRDGVVIVIVNVHYQAHFREITSNAPSPSVHLGTHSVTCNPHAIRALLLRSLPQRSPTVY